MVTEFPIPTPGSQPVGIATGPDGALWFIEYAANQIGHITPAGVITEFPVPTPGSQPGGITAGPDGALWFTESLAANIGRITTAGIITEFPTPTANSSPNSITAGPDGALWFFESSSSQIGRITTAGVITEFVINSNSGFFYSYGEITAGPDGALWFTGESCLRTNCGGIVFRSTTAGIITTFSFPGYLESGIAAGPDGALWFTDNGNVAQGVPSGIGRITTAGVTSNEFPTPAVNSGPNGITAGPDGALWFAENTANQIGRILPTSSLEVSPTSNIVARGFHGGPFSPSSFQYQISAATINADFSISGLPAWLTASLTSGTATTAPQTVTFTVNNSASTLAPGTYGPTTITFTNTDNGDGTQTRSAALVVLPRTATHDFNGDGYSDILWRNANGDTSIWLMNGTTILQTTDLGIVPVWLIVGQRDFNGDGQADLLWRNSNGDTSIWLMNDAVISQTTDFGVVPTSWSVSGTGDFNGDGYGDILWSNSDGDVAIWLMTGTSNSVSILQGPDFFNVPVTSGWTIAGTGDFNGDGMTDILWTNTATGDVSIWLMNGTTISQATDFANVPVASGWTIVGTGDFNGDGKSDILWRNGSTGDVSIWLMNGTTISQATDFANVPVASGWSIAVTGDFNGDGKSDIPWRNTNTGDISIWLMNGTTVSQATDFANVPIADGWTIQGLNAD